MDPILNNWSLMPRIPEPDQPLGCFLGEVHGHPLLKDGWIITSPIQWIAPDRRCARTSSRLYILADEFPRNLALPEKVRNIVAATIIQNLVSNRVFKQGELTAEELDGLMSHAKDIADALCAPVPFHN